MLIDTLIICLGALCLAAGFVFCVLPPIPGPALAYCGVLALCFLQKWETPSIWLLLVSGVLSLVVLAFDWIGPVIGAQRFKCTRWGVFGSIVGVVVGVFFAPWGLVLGPFLGAFLGEVVTGKGFLPSLKGATGAFLGFFTGVVVKLLCCLFLTVCFLFVVIHGWPQTPETEIARDAAASSVLQPVADPVR